MIMAQTAYNLDDLPREELVGLCEAILPRLPAADLKRLRDQAELFRRDKLEDAKNEILARMRSEFENIGLPMDEVVDISKGRRPQRKQLPAKYISPDGKIMSGMSFSYLMRNKACKISLIKAKLVRIL